jgi:hypothetical protein
MAKHRLAEISADAGFCGTRGRAPRNPANLWAAASFVASYAFIAWTILSR